MVPVRMGQQDVGNISWRQAPALKTLLNEAALTEGAHIDKSHVSVAAQQRNRAPSQTSVTHGLSGISLHDNVDIPPAETRE
jgi:hypothetical protein